MTRLIDADALKERKFPNGESEYITGWNDAISAIMTFQPTIDAEPVKHGKWIYGNDFHWYTASCNRCGYQRRTDIKADRWNQWNYCPNCGCRMDEK